MEGLEKLKTIRHIHDMECGKDKSINKDFDAIEKELKALEIFKRFFGTNIRVEYRKDTDQYFLCANHFGTVISKEEFNLLKEVLL